MLYTQTLEKLYALRLDGMAQALEEQRRQTDITELDFEARLGLLVERQWSWKENRSLARRLQSAQLKIPASLEDIDYRHPRGPAPWATRPVGMDPGPSTITRPSSSARCRPPKPMAACWACSRR